MNRKNLGIFAVPVLLVLNSSALGHDVSKFTLDTASTIKFHPTEYFVEIDHQNYLPSLGYSVVLKGTVDMPLSNSPNGKTYVMNDGIITIRFKNGKPIVNKEYQINKVISLNPKPTFSSGDNFILNNDDGSSLEVWFNFAPVRFGSQTNGNVRVTYTSVPEKAGGQLHLKFDLTLEDIGFMRGLLSAPLEEAPFAVPTVSPR